MSATRATPTKFSPAVAQPWRGLRQAGGIAGFPRRAESEYDAFGVGHSSTSISAALGMAEAFRQTGSSQRAVAVIGDGAMTAGMAFEALNNAGATDLPLLVVLNDNDMSISPNVGALNNYLARLMSGKFYAAARRAGEKVLSVAPPIRELAKRAEEHMKGMVTPGTLFEEFGFNYIGPIDGHDLDVLLDTLSNIKQLSGPQFLHVVTRKGKGYAPAEANPCLYHGVSRFDPAAGITEKTGAKPTYTQVFGDWLCDMAAADYTTGRHHPGDARRLGDGAFFAGVSQALFRRRHRRTACPDLCRRAGLRRRQTGGRDLLDFFTARV